MNTYEYMIYMAIAHMGDEPQAVFMVSPGYFSYLHRRCLP